MDMQQAIELVKQGKNADDVIKQMTVGMDEDHAEGQDVYLTQSFFIRCLEWARESADDDTVLHKFAEAVFSKSHPQGKSEGDVVRSKDFDDLVKQANETTGSCGVGGFVGGGAKVVKKPKKSSKKLKESATSRDSVLQEFFFDDVKVSPSCRIEFDCLEHALADAGAKQFSPKKARSVTNALARKTADASYTVKESDFQEVVKSLDEEEDA